MAQSLSSKVEDLCSKVKGLSSKAEDLSLKEEDLSLKAEDLSSKVEGLSSKAEGLSSKAEDLSTKVDNLSTKADNLSTEAEGESLKSGLYPEVLCRRRRRSQVLGQCLRSELPPRCLEAGWSLNWDQLSRREQHTQPRSTQYLYPDLSRPSSKCFPRRLFYLELHHGDLGSAPELA